MDSLTFLSKPDSQAILPTYAVHGEEDFLKRQVVLALRQLVLGDADEAFCYSSHAGDKAQFADINDELRTLPFLGPRRLVVIDNADPFVTAFRPHLERYVAKPATSGVLVLVVKTWPNTTRLAKALKDDASLVCKCPPLARLPDWCIQWVKARHEKQLTQSASRLLVDLVGAEMGLLDQELTKLALYVGTRLRIDEQDVDKLVASSRMENVWKILDAVGAGKSSVALANLANLFDHGQRAMEVLAPLTYQLRRLAQAYRLSTQGRTLAAALTEAGFNSWGAGSAEQQLRHLGRRRCEQLYDWLVEIDLGMKGGSQLPERTQLERLLIRLAMPRPA